MLYPTFQSNIEIEIITKEQFTFLAIWYITYLFKHNHLWT